ncbi:MAG: hypothetical protein KGD67_09195 [Candidatus Lokiarchaeota archaeon]|nr:hypothetical protein [Candidatus Lokiarchaeota archaeon]
MFNYKKNLRHLNKDYLKLFLISMIITLVFTSVSLTAVANDGDEDDDFKDRAKNFGVAAIGLFSVSIIYVVFYQTFINSKKILPQNDKFEARRAKIQKLFLKVKKPLSLIHYFAGFTAIILVVIHGLSLIGEGNIKAYLGLTTASFYLFFVILGITIKVVLKKLKRPKKLRRTLFKVHTSLIIFVVIISLHVVHIVYRD